MPSWLFRVFVGLVRITLSDRTLALQARKPSGLLGRFVLQLMFIKGNTELNALVLEQLKLQSGEHVLEIGFGPGVLLNKMAEAISVGEVTGHVTGLDFSETMFQVASERNQVWILEERMTLRLGSSDAMPFEDKSFDKVATSNTLYFWQPPQAHLQEIYRVLKPAGLLVLGFRDKKQMDEMQLDRWVFNAHSQKAVKKILKSAGFENVEIICQPAVPFDSYVALAIKPSY